jgi:hypothetical protein
MPTDPHGLLRAVAGTLGDAQIGFALIGASALAVHGVSRSTIDIDLLTTDPRVLASAFWSGLPAGAVADVRVGAADDPLAGVVRLRAPLLRDIDVVVGRGSWQREVIDRAVATEYGGVAVPAVQIEDVILLKLYAGGSQDRWDIEQLLARPDRDRVAAVVERRLPALPVRARELWKLLLGA